LKLAQAAGHHVVPFSRSVRQGFRRLPTTGSLDFSSLDAVVNLAGEPVLGLWTKSKKERILKSRVDMTQRVVGSLGAGVGVLINASAIGFCTAIREKVRSMNQQRRATDFYPKCANRGSGQRCLQQSMAAVW
jgi:NAD dependent epimerase/dehydratase family enzyme